MNVRFWKISGYEASADIDDEPVPGGALHRGVDTQDGAAVLVFWDEPLHRWQQVDPSLGPQDGPTDGGPRSHS